MLVAFMVVVEDQENLREMRFDLPGNPMSTSPVLMRISIRIQIYSLFGKCIVLAATKMPQPQWLYSEHVK